MLILLPPTPYIPLCTSYPHHLHRDHILPPPILFQKIWPSKPIIFLAIGYCHGNHQSAKYSDQMNTIVCQSCGIEESGFKLEKCLLGVIQMDMNLLLFEDV